MSMSSAFQSIVRAMEKDDMALMRRLLVKNTQSVQQRDRNRLLRYAAALGRDDAATILIYEYSVAVDDTNRDNMTALHIAARLGVNAVPVATVLLKAGATIDARNALGQTPLMIAIIHKRKDMIRLLLESGADPRLADQYGRNALHHAAASANSDIIRFLLEQHTNSHGDAIQMPAIDAVDAEGDTILHLAAANAAASEALPLLIAQGADSQLAMKNKQGIRPVAINASLREMWQERLESRVESQSLLVSILRQQLESMRDRSDEDATKITRLQTENDNLKKGALALREQLSTKDIEIEALRAKLKAATTDLQSSKDQSDAKDSTIIQLEQRVSGYEAEKTALLKQVQSLTEAVRAASERISVLQRSLHDSSEQKAGLSSEICSIRQILDRCIDIGRSLVETDEEIRSVEQELRMLPQGPDQISRSFDCMRRLLALRNKQFGSTKQLQTLLPTGEEEPTSGRRVEHRAARETKHRESEEPSFFME